MARNTHFQFKQFTIQQDRCAMKVCTDACVFGAWIDYRSVERVLDIGVGTGLLSLMAAQLSPGSQIDGIEIDPLAADQAIENIEATPFASRISVFKGAVQEFIPAELYDLIITNPPFFQEDLRSPDQQINGAHHAAHLTFHDLLIAVNRLVKPDGRWSVLLPPDESKVLVEKAMVDGWMIQKELILFHDFTKKPLRRMTTLVRNTGTNEPHVSSEIAIFESDGKNYTVAFRQLLQEFYLKF